jgi:hypothetical protein
MDDFDIDGMKIKDESQYERDGTTTRVRVYAFYLGKHGPFVEKVSLLNFDPSEIGRRVEALRAHLRTLPT